MLDLKNTKLAVIGLGYVGLPLAVEFSKKRNVYGFDINLQRIKELEAGVDLTLELSGKNLTNIENIVLTSNPKDIAGCNVYIVTVPTPVDKNNKPDLTPLLDASKMIGGILKAGDVVIYESTVYPGCTEEDCVPILEKYSKLTFNRDFYCGYSPERINPGDKSRSVSDIKKVTSGSTNESAKFVNELYLEIITAGTYLAENIKVAEASKVIENTQRDVNIALVNELAIIFNSLGIDTQAVLKAAETKWNFLPFKPGLVGGHCIGIDPYYLKHKAQSVGYQPEIISAVRRLNDGMSHYVASQLIKAMIKKEITIQGSRILVMGCTFKEDCPDTRNSKVFDVIGELEEYGAEIDIYDPWLNNSKAGQLPYLANLVDKPKLGAYHSIILAVAHSEFKTLDENTLKSWQAPQSVIYDLKHIFPINQSDIRL